jgi:hypothetical protein
VLPIEYTSVHNVPHRRAKYYSLGVYVVDQSRPLKEAFVTIFTYIGPI